MNPNYKIKVFGNGDWYSLQVPRIIEGLKILGHEVVSDLDNIENFRPDFIYCNDPGTYQKAIEYQNKFGGKLIFNVLDLPSFLSDFDDIILKLKESLSRADIVTSISKTTQQDLFQYTGIKSTVIYNPVKDLVYDDTLQKKKPLTALYCGRANSINKRFSLIINSFRQNNLNPNKLIVCGSENPFFGQYAGIISNEYLNKYYNASKIYLHPSQYEGIGLGMIEALICGVPVVACNDCAASVEFCPPSMLVNPNSIDFGSKILDILHSWDKYHTDAKTIGELYKKEFDKITVAGNIVNSYTKTIS